MQKLNRRDVGNSHFCRTFLFFLIFLPPEHIRRLSADEINLNEIHADFKLPPRRRYTPVIREGSTHLCSHFDFCFRFAFCVGDVFVVWALLRALSVFVHAVDDLILFQFCCCYRPDYGTKTG